MTRDSIDLSILSRVLQALFGSTGGTRVFGVNDCDAVVARAILSALASSTSVEEADLGLVTKGSSEELLESWRDLHDHLLAPMHCRHRVTTLKLDTGALYRGNISNIIDELLRTARPSTDHETTGVATQHAGIQTLEIDGFPELHDVELGEAPPEHRIATDCRAIASLVQTIGPRLVSLRVAMPADLRLPASVVDSIVQSCCSLERLDLSGAELSSLTFLLDSCERERSNLSHLMLSDVVLRDSQSVHALVAALRATHCTRLARLLRSLTLWPVAPEDCGIASPIDRRELLDDCLAMLQTNNRLQRLQLGIHDASLYDEYRPLFERHQDERIVGESALDPRQTAALLSVFLRPREAVTRRDAVCTSAHKLQRVEQSHESFVRSIITRIVDFAAAPSTRSIEF
ncbi:hypothetical protein PINS_up009338 [Pythium insidiosum]|nr:hypothetical protein PINS_up009338 [Pythium insidiosum]